MKHVPSHDSLPARGLALPKSRGIPPWWSAMAPGCHGLSQLPRVRAATGRALLVGALFVGVLAGGGAPVRAGGMLGARAARLAVRVAPSVATITAARLEDGVETSALAFDVSAPLSPTAFVLADPDRAIIDLPQVDFTMDPATGRLAADHSRAGGPNAGGKAPLVASFRFGLLAPGRSRIVVDLGAPARIVSASVRAVDGRSRLIVEFARTDRAAFRAAARAQAPVNSASLDRTPAEGNAATNPVRPPEGVTVATSTPDAATIVLDPGHGGPDTGAIFNGVIEKNIALAFATRLAAKLEATGTFRIVMTRSTDVFIPLSERVRIARESKAALMISIHADTLPETGEVGGATVYTVSDKASDAYAAKVAAKENAADTTVGVDGQPDKADVNDILFDLTRQETRAYSHVFARTLVNYWKVAGRLNKNPQRAAGFVVLKAPDVPSVLLELGYLSNATDAASLSSTDWREKASDRMAEAIIAYFADRQGPAKAQAGVPMPLKQAANVEPAH